MWANEYYYLPELLTSHLGRVRVESRVMRVESESSHEPLRSVLESSQVTSHRGLESSHTKLSSHARATPYCCLTKLINRKRDRMLSVYVEK